MKPPDGYVTTAQAAQLLGISRTTLYRWSKAEGLPIRRPRGADRGGVVNLEELNTWMRARYQDG